MEYTGILDSQVFRDSRCLEHENWAVDTLQRFLEFQDYQKTHDPYVMTRGDRRVILALVDSISSRCAWDDISGRDTVITDNHLNRPLPARVLQMPRSWFGIYSHRVPQSMPVPDRDFSMPINRIDHSRMQLLLSLYQRGLLNRGYVNFNCNDTAHSAVQTFQQRQELWQSLGQELCATYGGSLRYCINALGRQMPYRNHDLDHDTACVSGRLHVVVETYDGVESAAVSEKIFRALCLPRAWILYGCLNSVQFLASMGFDVMADLVDHARYDALAHDHDQVPRLKIFLDQLTLLLDRSRNCPEWIDRAQQAARHNRDLLLGLRRRFPDDWLDFMKQVQEAVR